MKKEFLKDFDIEIKDEDLRKRLAKVLCGEIEESLKANAGAYSLFRACENNYLGRSWWKQRGQRKNKPWLDACDFWTPLTEWIICAIAARIDSILFGVEPMMTAFAVESSDVEKSDGVTDFVDMATTQIVQLRKSFAFYIKQKIKQPLAVYRYEWEYEEEKVREVEGGIFQEDFTVKLDSGKVVAVGELPKDVQDEIRSGVLLPGQHHYWYVERDKAVKNQPVGEYVAGTDYVWSANTKKGKKPFMEGYRFWQTLGKLRQKQKTGQYWDTQEIKDALRKTIDSKGKNDNVARVITERSHLYESFKLFTRLPFNDKGEIDLDNEDAVEQEVIAELAYNEQVLLSLRKWNYLRDAFERRVFLYGFYEEKDAVIDDSPFLGRSMTEKIEDINKLMNKEFQQIVDNADLAMCKIFTKKRQINEEEWEQPDVFPGAFWDVDEQGDIQPLDVGDVKRIGFEIMNQLQDFAVRISNISSMNVSSRMEGGKPLATEVVNILKEGEVGREGFIQSCHEDLRQIYKWTTDFYFQFMPEGLERRIRGEEKKLTFPEPPKQEMFPDEVSYQKAIEEFAKNKYYNRDELVGVGRWDFKWNGTQLSGDREWQIQTADYLANVLPKFSDYVTFTGIWELLRDILIARGKKDWQKYLKPKEMIAQVDQQQMAMEQLRANLPNIRQKLIAQGMDPQTVEMTMARLEQKLMGGQNVERKPPERNVEQGPKQA